MIRNNPGISSYFQGNFAKYGLYQWNIKYQGFHNEAEIESAVLWAFGDNLELLEEIVGKPIDASIQGRSGGWLVIDTELSTEELLKLDDHVNTVLTGLELFLKEERAIQEDLIVVRGGASEGE
jgi:hypothetical protein